MNPLNPKDINTRTQQAVRNFENGFNCAQAVFMAYSDLFGIQPETAAGLATSFGGGMGRLREVCGAVSGMFLILSLRYPAVDVTDKGAKMLNYEAVQRTALSFKKEMGSYICADLLKTKRQPDEPTPSERNAKYYNLRPCSKCVAIAAEIVGEELMQAKDQ